MKRKIEKYLDNLFDDIYETRQLSELKEEIASNLLEKINDFIADGDSEEAAFNKGVSNLGNMNELVDNLKKASKAKVQENLFKKKPLDKKHVLGYVAATTVFLCGLIASGIVYLQMENLLTAAGVLMTSFIVSSALFVYFGLTQETISNYGMESKRAVSYSLATGGTLSGIFIASMLYFNGNKPLEVLSVFILFCLPSVLAFIYLGLTEKSRRKIKTMDLEWQKQWLEYYSNPQSQMVRGTLSGALWIFTTGIFLVGFFLGWWFSWVVFVFGVGFQLLIESYYYSKKIK